MTKLERLRWLLANTKVEEDIPAIAELVRAEEVKEAKDFMESRGLTEGGLPPQLKPFKRFFRT